MDEPEIATFLDRVVTDAERAFGTAASPRVLGQYAQEAALEFWMARPQVTVAFAKLVGERVREALMLGQVRVEALAAD